MTRIVFIGDSITDCGRRDAHPPYGDGYVHLLRQAISTDLPGRKLTWVNRGVSGDTVLDLAARWQRDAIAERPDLLSVMIGINDVWRAFDGRPDLAVPLDVFETTLRELLRDAVATTGTRLVLADPYIIEPDTSEPQRAATDRYRAVVGALATEFDALHVAVQEAFDRALADTAASDWSDDRIHPNTAGHRLIADEFRRVVGDRWIEPGDLRLTV